MARAVLSYQQVARTGLNAAYAAVDAAEGEQFANDGRMILHVVNGAGAPINVTITTPNAVDGLAVADLVVAVPNGESRFIGPFPPGIYNNGSGNVLVDYSSGTTVTVALLRL